MHYDQSHCYMYLPVYMAEVLQLNSRLYDYRLSY